jgi:hypothetical protein
MDTKPKVSVILRGGLGNQLFQVAAALALADGNHVEVFNSPGSTRATQERTDILYFNLPVNLKFKNPQFTRFLERLVSLNLKMGLWNQRNKLIRLIFKAIELFSDFSLTIFFRIPTHLVNATDVGFFKVKLKKSKNLLNGYFQSEAWANNLLNYSELKELKLITESVLLKQLINQAKSDAPIILHIRLGDYRNEPKFGVLKNTYFINALKKLENLTSSRKIWIFSNEPDSVKISEIVPPNFSASVIDEPKLNSAETLELMRYGASYVISNSTYSWWAAFLRYNKNAITIMPTPWFKAGPSPTGIKPKNWIEIESIY